MWIFGLLMFLCVFGSTQQVVQAQAADITSEIDGLDKPAKIEERIAEKLEEVSTDAQLESGQNYRLTYSWKPKDGTKIVDGDTARVTLPNTASLAVGPDVDIKNNQGEKVAKLVENTDNTAEIVFNGTLASATMFEQGTLHLSVVGNKVTGGTTTGGSGEIPFITKNGWVASMNDAKLPSQAAWNIAFNPKSKDLGDVTLTDTLGAHQTFIPGSVNATEGENPETKLTENSDFKVTASGSTVTMTFFKVTKNISLTYLVSVASADFTGQTTGVLSNRVELVAQSGDTGGAGTGSGTGSSSIGSVNKDFTWGGDAGDGLLNGYAGKVTLTKLAAGTGVVLPGAEYTLQKKNTENKYENYQTNLRTNLQGEFIDTGLGVGDYQFIETKAPAGYALSKTPISFSITRKEPTASRTQEDDVVETSSSSSTIPGSNTDSGQSQGSSQVVESSSHLTSYSESSSISSTQTSSTKKTESKRNSTSKSTGRSANQGELSTSTLSQPIVGRIGNSSHTPTQQTSTPSQHHRGLADKLLPKTNEAKTIYAAIGGLLLLGSSLSLWQYRRTRKN